MNYMKKLYEILEEAYLANERVLEGQNEDFFQDPNFSNLYQAYSIANIKLKNALELFQIILDDNE